MTSDPGLSEPPVPWSVWLTVAYLRLIRRAVACRVLPPPCAMWLTARYRRSEAG
jgi:hypothetical protein